MFKVPVNFGTFAPFFDLTHIEEDFLLHLVWKARRAIAIELSLGRPYNSNNILKGRNFIIIFRAVPQGGHVLEASEFVVIS